MDHFFTQIPTTITGWVATIIVVGGSISYLFSRIRKNDMDTLRSSNEDLRSSIEDNQKRVASMQKQIVELQGKVSELEKKNRTLEDLVVTALKQFFFENPQLAGDIQKKVMR